MPGEPAPNLEFTPQVSGADASLFVTLCVIQQLEVDMKSIVSAVFTAAMLVASIGAASAASWIQASSTEEQLASDPKPKGVTMNSVDGKKNITMDKGVIRVN